MLGLPETLKHIKPHYINANKPSTLHAVPHNEGYLKTNHLFFR